MTACNVSRLVAPSNGRRPARNSYSTTPREKMSLRASTCAPEACSGDMYAIVPRIVPGVVRCSGSQPAASALWDSMSFCESKIGQIGVPTPGYENVVGLDVAMQLADIVSAGKSVSDSRQQLNKFGPPRICSLFPRFQGAAIDELGDEILSPFVFAD